MSPLRSPSASKGLLGGVHHVKEAILVLLLLVDLRDGGRDADHAPLVDQQKESLVGVQLESAPNNLNKLTHVDVVRNEEFGLVQHRQLFLPLVSFDDYWYLVRMLVPDLLNFLNSVSVASPLFERLVRRHFLGWRMRGG